MKFVISKADISAVVNNIQNVLPAKATVPILSNLLIEVAHDELIVTATDLTLGVRCYMPAKVIAEGSTTLPAKQLASLLRELTSSNIEFTTNSHELTEIIADASRFKLNGMSKNEYPALPDLQDAMQFKIKQSDLKNMFYLTSFAVSREDNRFVLTGVLMRIAQGKATFMGTDGKRLAKASTPVDIDPAWKGEYIIPLKAVEEAAKNLSDDDTTVTVYLMADKIAIETNKSLMISKLLIGEYPNADLVIPTETPINLTLPREELIALLRQVSLFIEDGGTSVRFTFVSGELRIAANSMVKGEGKVSIPVNYQGDKLDIAFNPNYFADILRHCTGETVILGLTDSYNPGVILENGTPMDITVANPIYVLMPMRLNEEGG